MPHIEIRRVASIDGEVYPVAKFVQRTVSGWQVRVRSLKTSLHFADANYGGPAQSLIQANLEAQSHIPPPQPPNS